MNWGIHLTRSPNGRPTALSGGFLLAAGSGQLSEALGYISGFLSWWVILAFLANRRLYRLELE